MWQEYIYSGPTGSRPYFVYTPTIYQPGVAVPLVVMLHGCGQTPIDFAIGTQMHQLAEQHNFIAVYPGQVTTFNPSLCWNWFEPVNQLRDSGEPAIIAGIVQSMLQTTAQWSIDPQRIYVAGLSAGAALSVTLGVTYPDLFAAIGVHSGLEYQEATNPAAAVLAELEGGPNPPQQGSLAYAAMGNLARVVPTIVFHGTSDTTINPINGDQVVQQWMYTDMLAANGRYPADFAAPNTITTGQVPQGYRYVVSSWNDADSNEIQQYWQVTGMGHSWSGGDYRGTYTDPRGPSASQAMYLFFMRHPLS